MRAGTSALSWLVASFVVFGGLRFAFAAEGEAAPQLARPEPVKFAAWVESGEFIGDEQIRRLYVTAGSNHFGFIVPSGLRVDLSHADRVTLMDPELSFFLTLRINGRSTMGTDVLREKTLQQYPGALVIEESSAEVAGAHGPLFNLRWKPAEGVDRIVTVALIPNAAGLLEFSAVADRGRSFDAQSTLTGLMQRFQSSQGERLRMETFRQPDYN